MNRSRRADKVPLTLSDTYLPLFAKIQTFLYMLTANDTRPSMVFLPS